MLWSIFMINKIISLFISFILINCSNGQEFYPTFCKHFNWTGIEKKDKRILNEFIKDKRYFEQFRRTDEYGPKLSDLPKSLHLVDLDNDGIDEIIFDGESGGEGNKTQIFQKINNSYELVFTERQNIDDIKIIDKETKIYISDYGCCAEYTAIQKIFRLTKKNKLMTFDKIYQSILYIDTKQPDSLFEKPLHFKVAVDNYKLRYAPKFDDSSYQIWDDDEKIKPVGNVIANMQKNSLGYAFGFKTDKSGRQWWLVEIDDKLLLRNLKLYIEDNFPTKVIGWTSSKYLERL